MPQRLHHDVDLNTTPLLAYNAKVVKDAKVGQGFLIQNQVTHLSFYLPFNKIVVFINNHFHHTGLLIRNHRYATGRSSMVFVHPSQICPQTQMLFSISYNVWSLVAYIAHWFLARLTFVMGSVRLFVSQFYIEPHSLTGNNRTNSLG